MFLRERWTACALLLKYCSQSIPVTVSCAARSAFPLLWGIRALWQISEAVCQSQPFSYPRLTVKKLSHHSLTKLLADAHSSCLLALAISQERSGRSHLLCLLPRAGRCWLLPSLGSACCGQGAGQAQHPHAAGTASVHGYCQARAQAWAWQCSLGGQSLASGCSSILLVVRLAGRKPHARFWRLMFPVTALTAATCCTRKKLRVMSKKMQILPLLLAGWHIVFHNCYFCSHFLLPAVCFTSSFPASEAQLCPSILPRPGEDEHPMVATNIYKYIF